MSRLLRSLANSNQTISSHPATQSRNVVSMYTDLCTSLDTLRISFMETLQV